MVLHKVMAKAEVMRAEAVLLGPVRPLIMTSSSFYAFLTTKQTEKKNPSGTRSRNQNNVSGVKNPQTMYCMKSRIWTLLLGSRFTFLSCYHSTCPLTSHHCKPCSERQGRWRRVEHWDSSLCWRDGLQRNLGQWHYAATKNKTEIKIWLYNYKNPTC